METFEQQQEFFLTKWPELQSRLEESGPAAAIDFINSHEGDLERRVLFVFARQGMVHKAWRGQNLDAYIAVAEAGIAELLRQAANETDPEMKKKRTNSANAMSYNLGADLAFCWGDAHERNESHFRRGLKAGNDCLHWRRELGNPHYTFNMAHWLRGIHRLALGDSAGALVDMEDALDYAKLAAAEKGVPTELEGGDGSILLSSANVAQVRLIMGDENARPLYEKALGLLRAQQQSDDEETREDADWYVKQLEVVENLLLKQGAQQ